MSNEISQRVCPVAKKCSGCQLSNLSYKEQLDFKYKKVSKLLSKFCEVSSVIPMKNPYNYRNKASIAYRYDIKLGRVVSGVYQSTTHAIIPVDKCFLNDKLSDEIAVTVRKLLKSFRISCYNEKNGSGFLRYIMVRRSFATNQTMVVIVGANPILPAKNNFVKALVSAHPEITTIVLNVNKTDKNIMLGQNTKTLYGKGYIEDILCGCKFKISPQSFYQVNPVQAEVLYQKAIELAKLNRNDILLDAYCGTGTIGIACAKKVKKVISVEVNKDAVKDAISNVKANGLENVRVYCADATAFIDDYEDSDLEKPSVIILDPPRAGSTEDFLDAAASLEPDRIVYVSCNPETLARDLEFITEYGYEVKKIVPVDMFPHTNHVECVVCLQRQNTDAD